ncbi:MAG: hypothetical protein KIH69_000960 [Anaerolineae bacterium]|nr:hypothetical protein [Anaerolineae bacterium]
MKKGILIGLGVAVGACILFVALTFGGAMLLTSGPADAGNSFMTALTQGDYDKAWGDCHPALKEKIGGVQKLKDIVEGGNAKPVSFSISSRNVNNDEGKLEGTATLSGNRQANLVVELAKSGNDWKVIGFNIKAK